MLLRKWWEMIASHYFVTVLTIAVLPLLLILQGLQNKRHQEERLRLSIEPQRQNFP